MYYSLDHSGGLFPERARGFKIVDAVSVADGGNLDVDSAGPPGEVLDRASDQVARLAPADGVIVLLGGDDTVPYVGVRALARARRGRIAVVKFDSHFDLSWEPRYWAGSQWARLFEGGWLDPSNLAIIGIRGLRNSIMWQEVAEELRVAYWTMADVDERGIEECVREALERVADEVDGLYISLDLDVVDPAFLPAQKYPDPAGLTAREVLRALRVAVDEGPRLVGFDLACLGPAYDIHGLGAQLAARCVVEVIGSFGYRRARG